MAKLNADPAFVARRDRAEADRLKREAEYRRAEAPLVADLRDVGCDVVSVWDLVNSNAPYPNAIPILLNHLNRSYPVPVREGIARALAVPASKAYGWQLLVNSYLQEHESRVKEGLAAAIAATATGDVIHEVIALVRDVSHGSSRVLLLRALENSSDTRARQALLELNSDQELANEIEAIRRRLRHANR